MNLLGARRSHLGEDGLLALDSRGEARIKVFPQVDQRVLVANKLEDLGLSVHHVLVFQDLLDGDDLASGFDLGLRQRERAERKLVGREGGERHACCLASSRANRGKHTYLEHFAEGTAAEDGQEVKLVQLAGGQPVGRGGRGAGARVDGRGGEERCSH